jgi:hypothetical protein
MKDYAIFVICIGKMNTMWKIGNTQVLTHLRGENKILVNSNLQKCRVNIFLTIPYIAETSFIKY